MLHPARAAALAAALSIVSAARGKGPADCPDTNGDLVVDVDDLVNVIVAWGTGDADSDVTGDGVVDTGDLNAVIVGWGSCPPGSGGADLCAEAVAISGAGTFGFDNSAATTDAPLLVCGAPIEQDVWFCWTAACTGTAIVETCGSSVDTVIAAYDGCACPGANPLTCSDDACGAQSRVLFSTEAGSPYLLRIGSAPDTPGGTGTFVVVECGEPPANDLCVDAAPISGFGPFEFDNTFAGTDGAATLACGAPIEQDVWFCWTAACTGTAFVETCSGAGFDRVIAAYDGCACPEGNPLVCSNITCNPQTQVQFGVVAGNPYLLRIGSAADTPGGIGTFSIMCVGVPADDS